SDGGQPQGDCRISSMIGSRKADWGIVWEPRGGSLKGGLKRFFGKADVAPDWMLSAVLCVALPK
ncbi:MAG: hypothetical protein J5492_04765, partial [Oxalobacter sp.]|nr:hypothetical protein [Oxalobacter sp.]